MKQGYTVGNNFYLSKDFPIAEIVNYHNSNDVHIYYWSDLRINEEIGNENTRPVILSFNDWLVSMA